MIRKCRTNKEGGERNRKEKSKGKIWVYGIK